MFVIFSDLLYLSRPRKAGLYVSVQSKPLEVENPGTLGIVLSYIYSFVHPEAPRGNRVLSAVGPLMYSPLVGLALEPEKHSPVACTSLSCLGGCK